MFDCNGTSYIEVPDATMCSLASLPLCGRASSSVVSLVVNGQQVEGPLVSGDDAILLANLSTGVYNIQLTYLSTAPLPPPPSPPKSKVASYRDRFIGMDNQTGGDWPKHFGADGYFMYSLHASGEDMKRLPTTVSGIHTNTPFTGVRTLDDGHVAQPLTSSSGIDSFCIVHTACQVRADCNHEAVLRLRVANFAICAGLRQRCHAELC
eukprot:SAG31_NODE_3194_length_4570_cov_4.557593_2_plen_208_part_00